MQRKIYIICCTTWSLNFSKTNFNMISLKMAVQLFCIYLYILDKWLLNTFFYVTLSVKSERRKDSSRMLCQHPLHESEASNKQFRTHNCHVSGCPSRVRRMMFHASHTTDAPSQKTQETVYLKHAMCVPQHATMFISQISLSQPVRKHLNLKRYKDTHNLP